MRPQHCHPPLTPRPQPHPDSLLQLIKSPQPHDTRCIADAVSYLKADQSISPERRDYILKHTLTCSISPTTTARRLVYLYRTNHLELGGIGNVFYLTLKKRVDFLRTTRDERHVEPSYDDPTSETPTPTWNKTLQHRQAPEKRCEITGAITSITKSCHILSFANGAQTPMIRHLWALLRCFLVTEVVDLIIRVCQEQDRYGNGISMTPDAKSMFTAMKFYLEPLWDTVTRTQYTVRFHWVDLRPLTNRWSGVKDMETGDLITFRTVDAVKYPMPDLALVYIHMVIAKLRFPAGGGIVEEESWWYHGQYETLLDDNSSADGDKAGGSTSEPSLDGCMGIENRGSVARWIDSVDATAE